MENNNATTYFVVIHELGLKNMGIDFGDWSDLDSIEEQLEVKFCEIGGIHYTAICKSEKGLYHIHDVVTFPQAIRYKALASKYGNSHIEYMAGTKKDALDYIHKVGKYAEKGEIVLKTFGDIKNISDNRGKNKLEYIKILENEYDKDDFSIDDFLEKYAKTTSAKNNIIMRYSVLLSKKYSHYRDVNVIYVEGDSGSGKTSVALNVFGENKCCIADMDENNSFPFNNYKGHKILILDELRPGRFSPAYLFRLLDGYKINLNIKNGDFPGCYDTVVISAACPLDNWFKSDNFGQDNNRKQFLRRIRHHYKARKINGTCYWLPYDKADKVTEKDLSYNKNWRFQYTPPVKDLDDDDFTLVDEVEDMPFDA